MWDASCPPSKKRRAAAGGHAVVSSLPPSTLAGSALNEDRQHLCDWLTGLLEAESPVVAVEMQAVPDTGAVLVAAALEGGGATVWQYEPALQGAKHTNQLVRLRVKGAG